MDKARRVGQRSDSERGAQLKGMRWALLKDVGSLKPEAGAALHALITVPRLTMTARTWANKERLGLGPWSTSRSTCFDSCCCTEAPA